MTPAVPSTRSVALLLRLWITADPTEERDGTIAAPGWNDGSPLMRMLRQAVTFDGGAPDELNSRGEVLCANFSDGLRAAKSARHIQGLVTGFAGAAGQRVLAASIAVVHGSDSKSGDTADFVALRLYVEQRAKPAQVVFASLNNNGSNLETVYKTQPVTELGSPPFGFKLHEFLWSYKEQAAAAAVQAHARATKQRKRSAPAPTPAARVGPRPSLAQRGSFARGQLAWLLSSVRGQTGVATDRILARRRASPEAQSFRLRLLQAGTGISFVAILGIGLLTHHRSRPNVIVDSSPASKVLTSQPELPAGNAVPVPDPKLLKPSGEGSSPAEKTPAAHVRDPAKKIPPTPEPETHGRGRAGLSAEQTRQVLSRGQAELDRGCYEKAIGYYRRVIGDDPLNGSAISGIDKARRRMQLDKQTETACR